MSDDPLAEFRRKQVASQPTADPSAATDGREAYRAFAGKDGQRKGRLDIRRKDGMAHAVGYNFIIEICYDRRGYTAILLVLSTMLVKVKGKRLRPIVDALKLGTCEFIQEWGGEEFDPPEDDNGPLVESIDVVSSAERRQERDKE
jgi:hypothetical protein